MEKNNYNRYFDLLKKVGDDVRIDEWARITRPDLLKIGSHVAIDMGVYISVGGIIQDYIHIGSNVIVLGGSSGELIMEDFTGISAGSTIVVVSDNFTKGLTNPIVPLEYRNLIGDKIIMRKFSLIGVNSVVLPNIEMKEGSVLGANSLLKCNAEPWTIYCGSPAKPIGKRDKKWILESAKKMGYEY